MSNLVGIDGRPAVEPNAEVIEFLKDALAEAKRGQVTAIAACWIKPDDSLSTGWKHGDRRSGLELIGAVTYLGNRITREGVG